MKRSDSPLARALHAYKEKHRFTIKQMVKPLGLDHLTIWRMLDGAPIKSLQSAQRLAQAFGWTAQELGEMLMYEGPPKKKRKKRRDAA